MQVQTFVLNCVFVPKLVSVQNSFKPSLVHSGRALNNQYLDLDKFLGTHISENLTWKIRALVKKAQQRLPSSTEEETPGVQTAGVLPMGRHRLRANVVGDFLVCCLLCSGQVGIAEDH